MELVMLFNKPAVQDESRRAADHSTGDETVESMKLEATGELESETSAGSSHFDRSPSPGQKDSGINKQCDQRESTKAEIGEIREENERLKMMLSRITKDYQSLRMHFFDIFKQEHAKKPDHQPTATSPNNSEEESELVSLSLGTSSSSGHKKEDKTNASKDINDSAKFEKCLALGLECKYEGSANTNLNETASERSPDSSFNQEAKEEKPGDAWPPSKVLKSLKTGDDEIALQQQPQVKKARVSIRSRCNAPTMNDGCQWRKYGQKVAKGNPCPRAYYRCTVAPSCPVRKQVQRCADDLSILITTYEGTHNHPLPVSATAIASTTSAAASMILADSSSSQPLAIDTLNSSSASATSATLHGLSFSLSDTSRTRPYYHLQNISISSTHSYPTITLDLTAQPLSGAGSHANQFSRFSTGFANTAPRYTSTSFNFSLSETNSLPLSWSNGTYVNYGSSSSQRYNRSPMGSLSLGRLSQEPFCQSFLEKTVNNVPAVSGSNNHALTDTIAKALTSDATFQSALAKAITSYVGAQGAQIPTGNACAASLLNRSTNSSGNPQLQGNMQCLQPSLSLPGSKSASVSPVDHYRENTN